MDYSKYYLKVKAKISQYGGDCFIIRKGELGQYNPATNKYESEEEVVKGKGILSNYDDSLVNGTSINAGDVKIMCIFDKEPIVGDVIKMGGRDYTVVRVNGLNPDGKCVIYYDIQAR